MDFPSIIQHTLNADDYTEINNPMAYLGHGNIGFHGFAIVQNGIITDKAVLPIHPQSHEQDEEAATVLTPMQGGVLRERRGNIFKDIVITGTTGFKPTTKAPAVPLFSGPGSVQAIYNGALNSDAAKTGYAYFLYLRSLFRKYWNIHRNAAPDVRAGTDFLYYNPSDDEFWLVEPMRFRTSRDRSAPLGRRYTIILKTLSRSDVRVPEDFLAKTQGGGVLGFVASLRNIASRISDAINTLRKDIDTFVGTTKNAVESVLRVAEDLSTDVDKLVGSVQTMLTLPSTLLRRTAATIEQIFTTAEAVAIVLPVSTIASLTDMRIVFDTLLARPELFKQRWQDQYATAVVNFEKTWGLGGEDTANFGALKDVREGRVLPNETIYTLSRRLLGDPQYAQAIIVLNALRAPYFSRSIAERAPGTLAPGDSILLPVFDPQPNNLTATGSPVSRNDPTFAGLPVSGAGGIYTFANVRWRKNQWVGYVMQMVGGTELRTITANTANTVTVSPPFTEAVPADGILIFFNRYGTSVSLNGFEEQLGVDFQLGPDNDIVFGAGDAATVAGNDNVVQAIKLKTEIPQGELPAHPWYGLREGAGVRATPDNLFALRYNAVQTILSDPRIERMSHVSVKVTKDTAELVGRIKIRNGGLLPFSVRI